MHSSYYASIHKSVTATVIVQVASLASAMAPPHESSAGQLSVQEVWQALNLHISIAHGSSPFSCLASSHPSLLITLTYRQPCAVESLAKNIKHFEY